ncbi:MurR/RpiR family transcriptional regulator [Nocardia panacis]|uniref:MurR/RpiR family transcriptional regulator n=1 Tax=Nocardia panacis TaxID=2340916 RepID=A0A3A4K319_9NOCA|nr:MurR/RpiR family transcriptional regulator [Nocardia panacis]RJO70874.1 MurR/RpiR family transcriptional regulator [Nocardia panacis]
MRESLAERIAGKLAGMPPAERVVAEYLRRHSEEALLATAQQIATATETSDATVVRTVKSLGYGSLQELRRELAMEVALSRGPEVDRSAVGDSVLERVFAAAAVDLTKTLRSIPVDDFTRAVQLLAEAETVHAFGMGVNGLLAEYLAMRLTRIGRRARASRVGGLALAEDLLRLCETDVMVLYLTPPIANDYQVALDHAATVGARVLVIVDELCAPLVDKVDVVLPAYRTCRTMDGQRLGGEVLTTALVVSLTLRDEPAATVSAETLTALAARLVTDGRDAAHTRKRVKP